MGLVVLAGIAFLFYRRSKRQWTAGDDVYSKDFNTRKQPYNGHPLVEADGDAEYKGAQLDSPMIYEMRQQPAG